MMSEKITPEARVHIVPNTELADRVEITYTCESDHEFTRVFAADITVPPSWDCPRCGRIGRTESNSEDNESAQTVRSHWDMLMERRSIEELADMLSERLKELRGVR